MRTSERGEPVKPGPFLGGALEPAPPPPGGEGALPPHRRLPWVKGAGGAFHP